MLWHSVTNMCDILSISSLFVRFMLNTGTYTIGVGTTEMSDHGVSSMYQIPAYERLLRWLDNTCRAVQSNSYASMLHLWHITYKCYGTNRIRHAKSSVQYLKLLTLKSVAIISENSTPVSHGMLFTVRPESWLGKYLQNHAEK